MVQQQIHQRSDYVEGKGKYYNNILRPYNIAISPDGNSFYATNPGVPTKAGSPWLDDSGAILWDIGTPMGNQLNLGSQRM